ncbi:MAG: hypothetical protein R3B54_01530 [Bdellovibrionota bacterium]
MTTAEFIKIGKEMLQNPTSVEKPYLSIARRLLEEAEEIESNKRKRLSYGTTFMILDSVLLSRQQSTFWSAYDLWRAANPQLDSRRMDTDD